MLITGIPNKQGQDSSAPTSKGKGPARSKKAAPPTKPASKVARSTAAAKPPGKCKRGDSTAIADNQDAQAHKKLKKGALTSDELKILENLKAREKEASNARKEAADSSMYPLGLISYTDLLF